MVQEKKPLVWVSFVCVREQVSFSWSFHCLWVSSLEPLDFSSHFCGPPQQDATVLSCFKIIFFSPGILGSAMFRGDTFGCLRMSKSLESLSEKKNSYLAFVVVKVSVFVKPLGGQLLTWCKCLHPQSFWSRQVINLDTINYQKDYIIPLQPQTKQNCIP